VGPEWKSKGVMDSKCGDNDSEELACLKYDESNEDYISIHWQIVIPYTR